MRVRIPSIYLIRLAPPPADGLNKGVLQALLGRRGGRPNTEAVAVVKGLIYLQ